MNQAGFGLSGPPNSPLPNVDAPGQPTATSGTSVFAVLVGMGFLVLATFFVLSFVAVWKRSEGRVAQAAPAVMENSVKPREMDQSDVDDWVDATVNLKRRDRGLAQLRGSPGGVSIAEFDHQSPIKVTISSIKNRETWYRVKGTYRGATVEGYMHSDIVSLAQSPLTQ